MKVPKLNAFQQSLPQNNCCPQISTKRIKKIYMHYGALLSKYSLLCCCLYVLLSE